MAKFQLDILGFIRSHKVETSLVGIRSALQCKIANEMFIAILITESN